LLALFKLFFQLICELIIEKHMKKRKGMSLDDKRTNLLQMYYERKEVLNLKEVEKYGAKRGIVL